MRQPALQREPGGLIQQCQSLGAGPGSLSRLWAWAVDRRIFCMGIPVVPLALAMVIACRFR
jgi:hypothetical protein